MKYISYGYQHLLQYAKCSYNISQDYFSGFLAFYLGPFVFYIHVQLMMFEVFHFRRSNFYWGVVVGGGGGGSNFVLSSMEHYNVIRQASYLCHAGRRVPYDTRSSCKVCKCSTCWNIRQFLIWAGVGIRLSEKINYILLTCVHCFCHMEVGRLRFWFF